MSIDYDQSQVAVPIPNYRVYTKEAWIDSWTLQSRLIPVAVEDGANQQVVGRLMFHAGTIAYEGSTEYQNVNVLELTRAYCKIEIFAQESGGGDGDMLERWIGVIEHDDREVLGKVGTFAVNQTFTMYGMERLLDTAVVKGSFLMSPHPNPASEITPVAVHIDTPLIFNRPIWGTAAGQANRHFETPEAFYNRYSGEDEAIYNPGLDATFPAPSCFGLLATARTGEEADKPWNLGEILNYLVSFFGPRLDPDLAFGFRLDTLERLLEVEPEEPENKLRNHLLNVSDEGVDQVLGYSPEGKSIFQILNELIRPERGYGWRMYYDDDACDNGTKGPTIAIFSINDEAMTFGDAEFVGSPLHADLDITGRHDVHWSASRSAAREFGRITVRGERVLSCFSISKPDGSLDRGWTEEEEAEYGMPPGAEPYSAGYDQREEYRARSQVWTEYIIPADWDFKAKNGEAGETATVVNPFCGVDGTFVEVPASRTTRDKRFEMFLPIERTLPDGVDRIVEFEHLYPLVVAKFKNIENEDIWIDLNQNRLPAAPRARVSMLNNRLGVGIETDPKHRMQTVSEIDGFPKFNCVDWETMIVTVAMRTETRISIEVDLTEIGGETGVSGDPLRWLVIDVPGAEVWLVAPTTVYGIAVDGTLLRTSTELAASVVRDDRPRLRRVAAMAQAWYSIFRRPAQITFDSLTLRLPPDQVLHIGLIVDKIVDVSDSQPIRSVIWSRRFDFSGNRSTFATIDVTPDFVGL